MILMSRSRQASLNLGKRLRLRAAGGSLDILDSIGQPLLRELTAGIQMNDGTCYSTASGNSEAQVAEHEMVMLRPGNVIEPELRWRLIANETDETLQVWAEVKNTTVHPIAVERIDVFIAPSGYCQADAREIEAAQTGWQSWSRATLPVSIGDAYGSPPPVAGPMLPPTEAERTIVPWMTLLRVPGDHSLLIGFTGARDQAGVIAIQPALEGHRCSASSYPEGVTIAPGATIRSENLLLIFDWQDREALQRYASELAAEMNARPWSHPITGWASWYYFFTDLNEEGVIRNLDALARERDRIPVEYVRVDDSYQAHVGDWLTPNDKYPRGMRFLSDTIRSYGYRTGVWLAPFLVSEESEVYANHPEWVVRDHNEQPINAVHNWGVRNYALDTTHPEVMEWLRHVVGTMLNEWNYEYLMIDFIYAAALRGRRHDTGSTSIQAYRRGLEIIREVAEDRYVLGCGGLFAPSVGLVDAMRVGPDIERFWRNESRKRDGSEPALQNAIRSTLAHYWMNDSLWLNDPDPFIVRKDNSDLTLPEIQAWTSIVALSGGVVQLSDDMSRLEPERAALIHRVLPPLGEAATPLGPCVDGMATRMQLLVDRSWERWLVAALFNWKDESTPMVFDPADWDWPDDDEYHLFNLWSGAHLGPASGLVELSPTLAHGVKLLSVHTALERPQLVGSTLHLFGGAVELADEIWSGDMLTMRLRCPGEHEGDLVVYVPSGYEYQRAEGATSDIEVRGRLLTVSLRLVHSASVSLHFRKSDGT